MAIGDVIRADAGGCTDIHYVDIGLYDVPEYGAVYVIDAERPAVVDAGIGTDYERILDGLDAVGIAPADLEVVALTHVHLDHAGGAGFLAGECPNAEVYVHGTGAPHLVDPSRLWEGTRRAVGDVIAYYTEPDPVPGGRITEIADGDGIDLGDRVLDVRHAPGHAPHQVVFFDPTSDAVFTGDAAGIYTPPTDTVHPTSPPPNFDPDQCLDDVAMLRDLDPGVLCYSHFGDVETGDRLERYAETLREWVDAVAARREDLGDDDAVVEYFVERADDERDLWGEQKAEQEVAMNVRGVLAALDRAGE